MISKPDDNLEKEYLDTLASKKLLEICQFQISYENRFVG